MLGQAEVWVAQQPTIDQRVLELRSMGFREFDAYHLASAEAVQCDRLVTCDDQFLRVAGRNRGRIKVTVSDPIRFVSETSV